MSFMDDVFPSSRAPSPRVSALQTRADMLERQLIAIQHRLDKVAQFGEDDFEDGSVILFQYQFVTMGTIYDYAMLKANGRWYGTGPKAPKAYSWDELVDWWVNSYCEVEVYLVTEATRVL